MSTGATFAEIAAQHQAEIVDDFLVKNLHAECSCGDWTGAPVYSTAEALADHAAHVHVVAGLATEEDE